MTIHSGARVQLNELACPLPEPRIITMNLFYGSTYFKLIVCKIYDLTEEGLNDITELENSAASICSPISRRRSLF